jgi:hypothetical protein
MHASQTGVLVAVSVGQARDNHDAEELGTKNILE